jgi:hypothetical protein
MKIEVSNGEIVDKYTILKIKIRKAIPFSMKYFNIHEEYNAIKPLVDQLHIDEEILESLYTTNLELWEIEDKLRIKESQNTFDDEFILLSRSVYKINDKRYSIKQKINEITNSLLKEEKILPRYKND